MVAVISKLFGLAYIETAEDIVSDAFLKAAETWYVKGMPANPAAWLYTVAKNNALYYFKRNSLFAQKVLPVLKATTGSDENIEMDFSGENIRDSQLQMMFAVCEPVIASEAQIGLALRVLCGFGIDEIAEAFFTSKETINKRLQRAKEKLRDSNIKMEMPPAETLNSRLNNVLHIIYLLFNEGYYSITHNDILRKDLCLEAIRLGVILTDYSLTNQPKTNALMALMCYHSSRLDARQGNNGNYVLYDEQDESLWDRALVEQGNYFFSLSARGEEVTSYHIEASIAYWHCKKNDSAEKWENILELYNRLLQINYSPSVALNRLFALYKAKGREEAITEAETLKLDNNHFYFVLLGELYKGTDNDKAKQHYHKGLLLAKTQADKNIIQRKMDELDKDGLKATKHR